VELLQAFDKYLAGTMTEDEFRSTLEDYVEEKNERLDELENLIWELEEDDE